MDSKSSESDFRILLIGRTGHGKSSTGNTIIGDNVFEVSGQSKSKTKTCKWSKKYRRFGKVVEVVDTPGIFDTDLDSNAIHKELLKALVLSTPGFHVIAFVLMKGRFTEEIQKTRDLFFQWFGPGVEKFACVILTDTDNEDEKPEYIYEDPQEKLAALVKTCGDNVMPLNNKASNEIKDLQVKRLFEVAENIKQKNCSQHFSNVAFQLAKEYINSKCPKKLTMESIHILRQNGLSMKLNGNQCEYLDKVFTLSTENADERRNERNQYSAGINLQDKTPSAVSSVAVFNEQSKICGNGSMGNLPIFDSSSNERICNTQGRQRHMRQDVERIDSDNPSSSEIQIPETSTDQSYFQTVQVSGRLNDQSNSNISQNLIHAKQYQNESRHYSDLQQTSASDQSEEQIHRVKQRPSSRRDRKIDIDSVYYETPGHPTTGQPTITTGQPTPGQPTTGQPTTVQPTPGEPIDDFKDKVNKGENGDEELHGLSGYFTKAWEYCKGKFSRCTLL